MVSIHQEAQDPITNNGWPAEQHVQALHFLTSNTARHLYEIDLSHRG